MKLNFKYSIGDIVHTNRTSGIVRDRYEDTDKYGQLDHMYTVEWGDGTTTDISEKELK